jgi:hypothetical protein
MIQYRRGAMFLACLLFQHRSMAADVVIDLTLQVVPENIEVFQGDTVVWRSTSTDPRISSDTRSYTGEWTSPVFGPGQTFFRPFPETGTFAYLAGVYSGGSLIGNTPATIEVQPLTSSRPAISLVSPPDGFVVPGHALLQAAVTNLESEVALVQFFDRGNLIGAATNAPYRLDYFHPADPSIQPPSYVFTTQAINKDGTTNHSQPIVVRDDGNRVFAPMVLPGGAALFFYSMAETPNCVVRTTDFTNGVAFLGWKGDSTVLDPQRTNDPVRIYWIRYCL